MPKNPKFTHPCPILPHEPTAGAASVARAAVGQFTGQYPICSHVRFKEGVLTEMLKISMLPRIASSYAECGGCSPLHGSPPRSRHLVGRVHPRTSTPQGRSPEAVINSFGEMLPDPVG